MMITHANLKKSVLYHVSQMKSAAQTFQTSTVTAARVSARQILVLVKTTLTVPKKMGLQRFAALTQTLVWPQMSAPAPDSVTANSKKAISKPTCTVVMAPAPLINALAMGEETVL